MDNKPNWLVKGLHNFIKKGMDEGLDIGSTNYSLGVYGKQNPRTGKVEKHVELDTSPAKGYSKGVKNGKSYSKYTPEKG